MTSGFRSVSSYASILEIDFPFLEFLFFRKTPCLKDLGPKDAAERCQPDDGVFINNLPMK